MSGNKSRSRADKLVHANHLSRSGGDHDLLAVGLSLSTPRFSVGFAICTPGANGGIHIGKFFWYEACPCHELEGSKTQMPELLVQNGEFVLLPADDSNIEILLAGVLIGSRD